MTVVTIVELIMSTLEIDIVTITIAMVFNVAVTNRVLINLINVFLDSTQ